MKPGIITITLEGATFQETERCRKIIHRLFELGFFNVKNGNFNCFFDNEGNLGAWEKTLKGRNDKPIDTFVSLEQFKIGNMPVDNSSVVKRI